VTNQPVRTIRGHGVSFIPENPLAMASLPFMTVLENLALTQTWRYARRGGFSMDWGAARADADATARDLGFRIDLYTIAKSLSGGNLQRMVIIRELSHAPRLILAT
jgi:simple sugar transport system ATP-binding protein